MTESKADIQTPKVLMWTIVTALFLSVIKVGAALMTQSMAIMASALDSIMDFAISFVNLIAAREAAKPPDEEHAYGHGKIESLAGLFQSLFIGLSGLYLVFESSRRILSGSEMTALPAGIGVMFFSLCVTLVLTRTLDRAQAKNQSIILSSEKLHYAMDALTNGGTILALFLVAKTGFVGWDLVVSILISLYIFLSSYKILRRCVDELMDKGLPPVSKEEIEDLIQNFNPAIVGVHKFRSRRVGHQLFLDFHIEIRDEKDFKKAHDMTEDLIEKIKATYPGSDVMVHYDPEGER